MATTENVGSTLRNLAIIAHVDHGKTTLVDSILKATGVFPDKLEGPAEQILDSMDLERERGITILSKVVSVSWGGARINIVDTPGHADFGSEVERVLDMVEGALLVVCAVEGPMPQTRFVLRKALAAGLRPIVFLNKMDRAEARPREVLDKLISLFIDLGADEEQIEFPVLYGSGRTGWASREPALAKGMNPLLETIVSIVPAPPRELQSPFAMQVTMLDYSSYVGKLAIGRVRSGRLLKGASLSRITPSGRRSAHKAIQLQGFEGLGRAERPVIEAGEIAVLAGVPEVEVGDTLAAPEATAPLRALQIEAPALAVEFVVNDSPLAGREGRFVTARHLRERLERESQTNVGLLIKPTESEGRFKVSGRGELHLSILIERMRREGFEFAVSRPEVVYKNENGTLLEPQELLVIDSPVSCQGAVIESLGRRQARMLKMEPEGANRVRLEYVLSARGLMGLKSELAGLSKGEGLMHHSFEGYSPKSSDPPGRRFGVMIASEEGRVTAYALFNLQERGTLLVKPGDQVYEGMIVGLSSRENDLVVNPTKAKALSNFRTKSADDALVLTPPKVLTLEESLELIDSTELIEVTPKSTRLRKKILREGFRRRAEKDASSA